MDAFCRRQDSDQGAEACRSAGRFRAAIRAGETERQPGAVIVAKAIRPQYEWLRCHPLDGVMLSERPPRRTLRGERAVKHPYLIRHFWVTIGMLRLRPPLAAFAQLDSGRGQR